MVKSSADATGFARTALVGTDPKQRYLSILEELILRVARGIYLNHRIMRCVLFGFIMLWLATTPLTAQEAWRGRKDLPVDFPRPEATDRSCFFIQRNKNEHTIVYDLNLSPDGNLNLDEPLDNYWRQYASNGDRRELSWLESWLAYGYRAKRLDDGRIQIKLRAHKDRYIILDQDEDGRWRAIYPINGEDCYLTNIYAYADESGLVPDVKHVDVYGVSIVTGQVVKERLYNQ